MTTTRRRGVFLVLGAVLAAAVVAVALSTGEADPAPAASGPTAAAPTESAPTASVPTGDPDPAAGADAGTTPVAPISATPTTPASDAPELTTAVVGLAYADWAVAEGRVEAAGFVAGVIESGGTCTLELVRGATQVTGTSTGEADATTTNCGLITIPGDGLEAGEWQATLSYESQTTRGSSEPMPVEVPTR
ncbi:hypothetical protein [Modestobacter sp. VKM Ac-2978]|uniref:hypothetical protein n=1 Tax=Modestobacter sp. VKM Ac-2978 TaxID=3004132 RepID=UPI0022A9F9DD|nr:hypothetical protein [Modestobacter sp. VKM Ac-2978]MCZ2849947.1 hypothetical protein [Modestobacter sp. VKM Ac-2978]